MQFPSNDESISIKNVVVVSWDLHDENIDIIITTLAVSNTGWKNHWTLVSAERANTVMYSNTTTFGNNSNLHTRCTWLWILKLVFFFTLCWLSVKQSIKIDSLKATNHKRSVRN